MNVVPLIIKILIFFSFIGVFTPIYMFLDKRTFDDALYISTSFQTFTGTNLVDLSDTGKKIATFQLIFSYVFVSIIIYSLIVS